MEDRIININCKYLFFPISNSVERVKIFVDNHIDDKYDLLLRLSKDYDYLTWLDVSKFIGKDITITGEKDKINLLYQGNELPIDLGKEKYRPLLHFTPSRGWVNDPNGLVYANGKYHLFYQHNPYDVRWANMHWGHSVSCDLIHWEDLGEALFPDSMGTMFSGCGVYDENNTSGLGQNGEKPIILIYTAAGSDNEVSLGKPFTICLAYSFDGKEFIKYKNNPIIDNITYGNRDPKVVYDEQRKQWVMILFLDGNNFQFCYSKNLLDWEVGEKIVLETMNECPDLFKLDATDKWVILSGADYWGDKSVGKYFIGSFDGRIFTKEDGPYVIDFGKEFYSLQTYFNDPKNRRILVGWRTRDFFTVEKHNMPFSSEYSIPTQITKCEIDGKLRLKRYPVEEFFKLDWKNVDTKEDKNINAISQDYILANCKLDVGYIKLSFKPKDNARVVFDVGGNEIFFNQETSTMHALDKSVRIDSLENVEMLIIKDRLSIEFYGCQGKYPICGYTEFLNNNIKITVYRGQLSDVKLEIKEY